MISNLAALTAALRAQWRNVAATPDTPEHREFKRYVRRRHPRFSSALAADARITAARRGERHLYRSRADTAVQILRLMLVTESFFGQCCYRAKASCQAAGIPMLPRLLNHLAVQTARISIGDPVVVHPGIFIPHGQVCIDGITEIGSSTVIGPYTTIGLRSGDYGGPTIGAGTAIGTGARIIGPCHVGEGAVIGANAVVTSDIPAGAVATGVPARVRPGEPLAR